MIPSLSKKTTFLIGLLLYVLIGLTPVQAQQTEQKPIEITASGGYDGFYKQSSWTPVYVHLTNTGASVEGEIRLTVGDFNSIVYNAPISLPTQSNKFVTLYFFSGSYPTRIAVQLLDNDDNLIVETTTDPLTSLAKEELLYGVVGAEDSNLEFLEKLVGTGTKAGVALLDIAELPDIPSALSALNVLVFSDVDTAQLSPTQLTALQSWVDSGGQLVITGGPNWQKTTAVFHDMLPVQVTGSQSMADLPALSTLVGEPFRDAGPYLVAVSSLQTGELLAHQDGLPLLARRDWGRGSVYFLALDPKLAPLADWNGRQTLFAPIVAHIPPLLAGSYGIQDGYSAKSAVETLPNTSLPSGVELSCFFGFYILLVGPVNYFVLQRRNRRELAWATVPALVVVFTIIAYLIGFQIKGNQVIINEYAVAYGRVGSDQIRVQTVFGLYSPKRAVYDLRLPGDVLATSLSQATNNSDSNNFEAITFGNDVVLSRVRVDVSGVEAFVADSYQPMPPITVEANVSNSGSTFTVQIFVQNQSQIDLSSVTLVFGGTAVALGDLAAGESKHYTEPITLYSSDYSSYANSLAYNASTVLGSSDYYNDPNLYGRYQFLNALTNSYSSVSTTSVTPSLQPSISLLAWSTEPQVDVDPGIASYETRGNTLYIFDIPFENNINPENATISLPFLNWQILNQEGMYDSTITNFNLGGGWVEIEYTPWPEFQNISFEEMSINLIQDYTTNDPPRLSVWDWQKEKWVALENVAWGETAVADTTPFLNATNSVRIRLEDTTYGTSIASVYPILSNQK